MSSSKLARKPIPPDLVRPLTNRVVIRAIPIDEDEDDTKYPVLGSEWLNLYQSCMLIGKSGSGKTTIIWNLLLNTIGPETKVIIYCPTIHNDASWRSIVKHLKQFGITVITYTALDEVDERTGETVNTLKQFMLSVEAQGKIDKITRERENTTGGFLPNGPIGSGWINNGRERKKTFLPTIDKYLVKIGNKEYEYNPWLIIFDDMGDILRNSLVANLVKKNRHFRAKVLISSHAYTDFKSDGRQNIRKWFLFKGIPPDSLPKIHKSSGADVDYEVFLRRYEDATKDPHTYITIDTDKGVYTNSASEEYIQKKSLVT